MSSKVKSVKIEKNRANILTTVNSRLHVDGPAKRVSPINAKIKLSVSLPAFGRGSFTRINKVKYEKGDSGTEDSSVGSE